MDYDEMDSVPDSYWQQPGETEEEYFNRRELESDRAAWAAMDQ